MNKHQRSRNQPGTAEDEQLMNLLELSVVPMYKTSH